MFVPYVDPLVAMYHSLLVVGMDCNCMRTGSEVAMYLHSVVVLH